jgi:hypothetical protein
MKEQLVQLIDAYAAARASGNGTLQQFAAQQLSAFLEAIEVTAKQQAADEEGDGGQE